MSQRQTRSYAQWHAAIHRYQQGLWRWRKHRWSLTIVVLLLIGCLIRSMPYLAPIRAADITQTAAAIEFVDRNGLPLGTILTRDQEHTMAVPLQQVSPHFIQAIIAAEDGRFYQHGALDGRALGRSLLEAVQAHQIVSGASTITMQLARMLHPAPRTLPEKAKEIWTAWRLAAGMTRNDILQAYVNRLPMGGNVYGVEAAARLYFGIPASDLTIAQATLLAGIPNDPTRLNPYDYWSAAKARQTYVLDRMVHDRVLSRAVADRAYQEELSLQHRQQGIVAAPHFLFWLAQSAAPRVKMTTTIDRSLQQFVEAQVQQVLQSLAAHNVNHAAALVLDNHTGEVLAYVGSPNYFAATDLGRNDGVQALRQPGSTLKPFLYELALEERLIQPNTVLADVPTRYAIPGAKLYSPSDYSETFQGPVRVRVALANSLNVPAVRVLEKVRVNLFLDRLHQLGFTHLTRSPEFYGLGLALGSGEVSLWELARAYLTLANQGTATVVRCQLDVSDAGCGSANVVPVSDTAMPANWLSRDQGSSAPTHRAEWALITDMLSDAHARAKAFGVDSLLSLPFPAAVKTGTSSDFRDTWTVGFTRDYTVAVWVGNFDGQPMQQVSGVTGAAPLWNRIMLHLHDNHEPDAFPPPDPFVKRPICALSGARPTPACPTVVTEYVAPQDLAAYHRQPDPFYQTVSQPNGQSTYRLTLPAEYREWLALQPRSTVSSTFAILSPRHNDVFLLTADGGAAATDQRIQFRVAHSSQSAIEWRLNGHLLATAASDLLSWTPQPGTWTLQAKSGDQTDQVTFAVQLAETPSTRRGFSFAQ